MPFVFVLLILFASQIYWLWRAGAWLVPRIPPGAPRIWTPALGLILYVLLFLFNAGRLGGGPSPTHLTWQLAFLAAPFQWWLFSTLAAFPIAVFFWLLRVLVKAARAFFRRPRPASNDLLRSPARREFLERTATACAAVPFVAGAYGILYGRLDLETTQRRIRLARLPAQFHGFRIAQLSDIHIGPFMSAERIRQYAGIANALKPDLIVLTGDFVTWDPSTARAVVEALSGLRARFGVFGCLGNHEAWTGTEDSITRLFGQAGVRILRYERAPIAIGGETLNLLGVDFETERRMRATPSGERVVHRYLEGIQGLVAPEAVNILLSHNPNTFDRAADIGIDLSLAGHTHGGQVALEFVSPQIALSRLMTPYVAGWFGKPGGQLYVNRGIGTIGIPIRVGAPPEITVFELVRA